MFFFQRYGVWAVSQTYRLSQEKKTCSTSGYALLLWFNLMDMKSFFETIAFLFEEVLFLPLHFLRDLELTSWFLANGINWIFLTIGLVAGTYWVLQLKKFNDSGEEDTDSTSHSFL